MKIAVLFPGQGSQYLGMGQEFVKTDVACAALMAMAEAACELNLGDLCNDGPMEELTRATNLQPAITITNLICWQAFKNALGNAAVVSCFAGHSLGEYSALFAAGVMSAEDTMRLVSKRGALMEREGKIYPGGMRAVLGLDIDTIEKLIGNYRGPGRVTVANHNTPAQIVISGSMDALDEIGRNFEAQGAKIIALNVSVANHSPLVADAVPDFAEFMKDIEFKPPQIPVYFNVSGAPETDTQRIKEMMASQIAARVRWYGIIEAMLAEGVDTFIEVGPKTVLTGMMRKIVPKGTKVTTMQFDTPASLAECIEKIKT
ncbi:ACP S-malonyltransferase [Desulfopila sp. IMCC35006]|uniref:ACP S-malonyltransferase n=1 Tax=Desulfopila sp. IMCC35006 TaxID=2569542 RepID=UPI0010AC9EE7|nr:ACP S-malonyltransferase [Desulfopila sp. IMCC35006]TKB27714.1 ACP S-malonyltransferase [Desulfopila sp. IMCC35006]